MIRRILKAGLLCVWVSMALVIATVNGLELTSLPPLLDVPTYSLATFNKDGTTNMNILTYATPVSVRPNRVWALGLFRETLTEENLLRKPTAVLQLLTEEQAELVKVLGGNSGRDIKKRQECAAKGFEWIPCDEFDGLEVLPGCAHYLQLRIQGGLVDAGSHLVAPFCHVEGMFTQSTDATESQQLKTAYLRELGIINEQGRVADSSK